MSAVYSFVLSQSTRVTDKQTDGRADRITITKIALAWLLRAVKTLFNERCSYKRVEIIQINQKCICECYPGWDVHRVNCDKIIILYRPLKHIFGCYLGGAATFVGDEPTDLPANIYNFISPSCGSAKITKKNTKKQLY